MFSRVLVAAMLVFGGMVAVKDGHALERVGVLSSCQTVAGPAGDDAHWTACRAGKLEGLPYLRRRSCTSAGVVRGTEFWRCPASVGTGYGD